MANNKVLNARFQSKYDTYANWTSANPVLLKGEVAIVVVPAASGAVTQEPAILIKVGDGTKHFNDLGFISGYAADIHDWAKASVKPVYSANEITGMGDFISSYVQDTMGIQVDTNTVYKVEMTTGGDGIIVSHKEKGDAAWIEGDPIKFSAFVKTIAEGSANGTISVDGTNVAIHGLGTAAFASADSFDASGAATAVETTINAKLGTLAAGKTVAQMIADAADEATYDDSALAARVAANEAKLVMPENLATVKAAYDDLATKISDAQTESNTNFDAVSKFVTAMLGTDMPETAEGETDAQVAAKIKSIRTIANEELTKQLIPENAQESLDTLAEIAAWIQAHPNDVATINQKITALESAVGEGGSVGSQIDAKITALKLAETYDAKGAANTAETNAKSYADSLAGNYDAAGAADTALSAAKTYANGLADNYDAAGAASTALTDAKKYADGLADHYDAAGAASTAETNAKSYADGLVANKANWDKAQANVIETVKVNGTALTVTDKAVDITVPTKIEDLTQDNYLIFNAGSATEVI